jgi:hypothetical protein
MYAFEQDVPINAGIHQRIKDALGEPPPHGLLAHIAIEREDGHLSYLDLWDSKADCDTFTEQRLHPVVGAVLNEAGVHPDGEPPRRDVAVVDAWGSGFPRQTRV